LIVGAAEGMNGRVWSRHDQPADDLFTDAEPARKFSLRHSLGNSHLRDKGRDLIQSFDVGQS
jgi:hypothetical protein